MLAQKTSCLLLSVVLRAIFFQTRANYEAIKQHWANECEKLVHFGNLEFDCYVTFWGFYQSTNIKECFLSLNQLELTLALPLFFSFSGYQVR